MEKMTNKTLNLPQFLIFAIFAFFAHDFSRKFFSHKIFRFARKCENVTTVPVMYYIVCMFVWKCMHWYYRVFTSCKLSKCPQ